MLKKGNTENKIEIYCFIFIACIYHLLYNIIC